MTVYKETAQQFREMVGRMAEQLEALEVYMNVEDRDETGEVGL